jgi:RNA polymerase sigma-70 factor (ECF subfamily)
VTSAARFEAFVREYQDMVFATAVRLLGDPADAEDVAQAVFLRAFERFDRIESSPAVAGWLKTVTTNLCLNHLTRYRNRWRFFSELSSAGDDGRAVGYEDALPAADAPDAGEALDAAALAARLEQALRRLPGHQRVPLVLFHFDDMSYEAIAARLGVSLGKIKTDIHRGRLALRQVLADEEGGE